MAWNRGLMNKYEIILYWSNEDQASPRRPSCPGAWRTETTRRARCVTSRMR